MCSKADTLVEDHGEIVLNRATPAAGRRNSRYRSLPDQSQRRMTPFTSRSCTRASHENGRVSDIDHARRKRDIRPATLNVKKTGESYPVRKA